MPTLRRSLDPSRTAPREGDGSSSSSDEESGAQQSSLSGLNAADLLFYFETAGIDTTDFIGGDSIGILAALHEVVRASGQTLDDLHAILRCEYECHVADDYMSLVRDRVAELLRAARSGRFQMPQLLTDAAAAVTLRIRSTAENDEIMKVSQPHIVFDRQQVHQPQKPRDWQVTFSNVPFRKFGNAARPTSVARGTTTIPNIATIIAIIRFTAMPSPALEAQKKQLIAFLRDFRRYRIVLLFTSLGLKMKGVYKMEGDGRVVEIWGAGPETIAERDVETYRKYMTRSKQLEAIPTKHFIQTTDCICIKTALEPRAW
jgi:hypothetical protein